MGYIEHDLIVITGYGYNPALDVLPDPDMAAFRDSLPENWRPLVVGPVSSVVNCFTTWLFLPDGSKSGWKDDRDGELYRQQFVDLFSQHGRFDIVALTYGADHQGDFDQPQARYWRP